MPESHAWGLNTSFSCIKDNFLCLTHTSRWFCSRTHDQQNKFNSISLKYSKKARNVDFVSQVYHNTLKLLCFRLHFNFRDKSWTPYWSCGAVEVLKGSWNIFEKILCSVQMYWENCQKFLGCFRKPDSHDETEIPRIWLRKNWQVHTSPRPEMNGWTPCFGQKLKTMHPTLYFA